MMNTYQKGRISLDTITRGQPVMLTPKDQVRVQVDYKIILASNYISKRINELTGSNYEIGFFFGGTVKKEIKKMTITIDDIFIPKEQTITSASFNCTHRSTNFATDYFRSTKRRITGFGHSHSAFDVFHSNIDYEKCKNITPAIGMTYLRYPQRNVPTRVTANYESRTIPAVPADAQKACNVLPSIVFNAGNKYLHSVLAVRGLVPDTFELKPLTPFIYNKNQAELTTEEKQHYDRKIIDVLKYNNISYQHPKKQNTISRIGEVFKNWYNTPQTKEAKSA